MHCRRQIGGRSRDLPGGGPVAIEAHMLTALPFRTAGLQQAWTNGARELATLCAYCARSELQGVAGTTGVVRFVACIGHGCHWCGDWAKRELLASGGDSVESVRELGQGRRRR